MIINVTKFILCYLSPCIEHGLMELKLKCIVKIIMY